MSFHEITRLDLPASYSSLETARTQLEATLARWPNLNLTEASLYNLQLALHETLTNIIEHAYEGIADGRIEIIFYFDQAHAQLMIELHDWGISFDPTVTPLPNFGHPQEHGYGLFLIHSLMDEVIYQTENNDNVWRLVKKLA
ncbi:MAG: ATP-binding protein [Anaerolineales bacterium]|jgi:anti-sigma regulatory factor (Ser/Thr protein kinase)|nr:ATP-binding protein [Anaerolineales bacterium]